jgi:hypothetical protein
MKRVLTAAIAVVLFAAAPSFAAEKAGVKFDDSALVGGKSLALNGVGLRSILFFKAYVAGLYVPEKSKVPAALLMQKGPRRISLKMLMELSAEKMTKAFVEGIEKNHSEVQLAAMKPQIDQLTATMAAIGTAKSGDTVDLDFVDGATRISLNGQAKGQPIAGEDFYTAVMRIYIGEHPADRDLKEGLLGG